MDHKRRSLIAALTASPLLAHAAARSSPRPVVVMTSYPDEVITRFQEAFERAHPGFALQFLWRMPFDALPYLQQPGQGGVDVYWSASPRNFAALAAGGALRVLDIDRKDLPARVGNADLADPQGRYIATEMAAYGFAVNPAALERLGLSAPEDWEDLAAPALAGQIALPDPVTVGFAPVMIDIVLQAYGWQRGWALWSEIAGNAQLTGHGGSFVTDLVGPGTLAVGLSIDFFVASAIAKGQAIRLVYPRHTGINPAQVAILRDAHELEGARAFVAFLVSPAGQRILRDRSIRKLPVRPDAYADSGVGDFNPFAAASAGGLAFDQKLALPRLGLVTAVFGQMISQPHAELVTLWQRAHAAQAAGKDVGAVRALLGAPPLGEQEAADGALQAHFRRSTEGAAVPAPDAVESAWAQACQKRRIDARQMLEALGA
ncbi:MAG: extracellular solute-binding protein [Pseudomonadota bacterium]|nr:extracellular solute-binding protein [Pseudomonadota bacterium]